VNPAALSPEAWQRFQELLPWYINGTLGVEERREVAQWLALSGACRAEQDDVMALARRVRSEQIKPSGDAGLSRLMAMVHAHQSGKLLAFTPRVQPQPAMQKNVARWYKPAIAMAAAVAVVQVGAMLMYQTEENRTLHPLGATHASIQQTLIQVTFRTTASRVQMRGLISRIGAEMVDGPGALGVYTLSVPNSRSDAALIELRRAVDVVDSISVPAN
jgi:hypothetical protein